MSEQDRPPALGELVVRNGKKAGTRVPLVLPVTLIGRRQGCDILLSADGVADLHCLITVTPAGPVLRSWQPDQTLRNGEPIAAGVLADGDELKVGPCLFGFHWNAVVDLHEARPELPPDLLAQLAEARAEFRAEREKRLAETAKEWAALADERAELDRRAARLTKSREQVRSEREKARLVYRRYLKRMKGRWAAERKAVAAGQAELAREREEFARQVDRFHADREYQASQLAEYKDRLADAWHLLAENQKRLLADRRQAERWVAERTEAIERQTRLLDDREQRQSNSTAALEARVGELTAEIAGLEARAANTRGVLRQLEKQRAEAEEKGHTLAVASVEQLAVTLEPQKFHPAVSQEVDRLLTQLNESTQAAGRERVKLTAQRERLDREAEELADQRAVLAEQVAALSLARHQWQSSEHTTVLELEDLARALQGREQTAEQRERGLLEAERERRQREYDLWQLRVKLEGWQAALAAQEVAAAAARDRADVELDARREHLARWEASLESVQRAWAELRDREKEQLQVETQFWADAREDLQISRAEADRSRNYFLAEAEKLAARVLATEQADGAEPRRLRVLRKRWESHFARRRKELDERRERLAAEQARADERLSELRVQMLELADRQAIATDGAMTADRERIVAGRAADAEIVTRSIDEARRQKGMKELNDLRAEIERLSSLVLNPSSPPALPAAEPEVIPLVLKAA